MAFVFTAQESRAIKDILGTEDAVSALRKILSTSLWTGDKQLSDSLKDPLLRACAWYLYKEKRRGYALNNVGTVLFLSQFTIMSIQIVLNIKKKNCMLSTCKIVDNF